MEKPTRRCRFHAVSRPGLPRAPVRCSAAGFTLLEILIAVLVLSIGILGVAGMQSASLRNNQGSLQNSQAAALTYDMADRMRANPAASRVGAYQLAGGTPGVAPATAPSPDCASGYCTPDQLAAADLYAWQVRVVETLPRSIQTIECAAPCSRASLQTITIYWDQERTGAAGTRCRDDPADALDPKIELSCSRGFVQP